MPVILVKVIDFQIMNRYYSWKMQFLNASNLCKITITQVLGKNISLRNKIPLVLPFVGFPPMTKQVTIFIYIKLYAWSIRGVTTAIIQRTLGSCDIFWDERGP